MSNVPTHFYRDNLRFETVRHDIVPHETRPRPLGYHLFEVCDPVGLTFYGWVSPSGVSNIHYHTLEDARQGAWRDHNCAVRLGLNP